MNTNIKYIVALFLVLSAVSVRASEITGSILQGGSIPTVPATKTVTVSGTSVMISWSAVANVAGYKLYRSTNAGSFQLISDTITNTSYTDANLQPGLYAYQIQPFLGLLAPQLSSIVPTVPVTVEAPAPSGPAPTSSGSTGGGGGGGGGSVLTPTATLSVETQKVDTNKDNKVDVLDFVTLMAQWGKLGTNIADFTGDGRVDILDFVQLMANWTK